MDVYSVCNMTSSHRQSCWSNMPID